MAQDYDEETQSKGEELLKGMRDEAASKTPSFKEAFAAARSSGDKTFEWNGKSYGTALASESKAAPKAEAKATPKAEITSTKSEAPVAKKETYRDMSGNVRTKGPDTSAEDRAANRAKAAEAVKSAASSVGNYISSLGKREEKHGTYRKDGKIVKYAKGGSVSSASRRGDGIATKGKTRGKIY